MAKVHIIDQGYMSLKEAADYSGYSPKYFARLAAEHRIPKYGPKRNRFKRLDLDFFMANPSIFQQAALPGGPRMPGVFTPCQA